MLGSTSAREIARYRVGDAQAGQRLDMFLKGRIPRMSRTGIQRAIRARVELPGRRAMPKPSLEMRPGDVVVVLESLDRFEEAPLTPDLIPRILFADETLVAVDKPPGLAVHANRNSPRNHLIGWLRAEFGPTIALAHRIDRETSGVVLAVRTTAAAHALGRDFALGRVRKQYLAVVRGTPPDRFIADQPVGRDLDSTIHVKQCMGHASAGPACTRFQLEQQFAERALVRAFPQTGRRHQIRVHLAAHGFPIVGDKLYGHGDGFFLRYVTWGLDAGMRATLGADRHLLHAAVLAVEHPATRQQVQIEAPLPHDFLVAMAAPR